MGLELSKWKIKDTFLYAHSFGVLPVTLARILVLFLVLALALTLPLSHFRAD